VGTITEEGITSACAHIAEYSDFFYPAIAVYHETVVIAWIGGNAFTNGTIVAAQQTDSGFKENILLNE
jgi:hypothetical protein